MQIGLQNASIERQQAVTLQLDRFGDAGGDLVQLESIKGFDLEQLKFVWMASDYVAEQCVRRPQMLMDLLASGDLSASYDADGHPKRFDQPFSRLVQPTEAELMKQLRDFRNREMVRIAWRDIANLAPLEETLMDLSTLAETCIQGACDYLHAQLAQQLGEPLNEKKELQQLVVIGMGKLGAWELNFSSDIDLIFAFPEAGQTGGARPVANEQFFTKMAQGLVRVLNNITADGFVFRVDTRLRPFGKSGPLVLNFSALALYYEQHGREWERYAWIKARALTGDLPARANLMALMQPFIYRRYLDYGAIESLRDMKRMIEKELLKNRELESNIKLGRGGIREVEFIAQAFQLVRGGSDSRLQELRVLHVLQVLAEFGVMSEEEIAELNAAYCFLRLVENRLQQYRDQQTHTLPTNPDERQRLANSLGYLDWPSFNQVLEQHRSRVSYHFSLVFAATSSELDHAPLSVDCFVDGDASVAAASLEEFGFEQPEELVEPIRQFFQSSRLRSMSAQGRKRLDQLMPLVLKTIASLEQPLIPLQRILVLLEDVAGRSVYLSLLIENPSALSQLVKLSVASSWIVKQLSACPILLDQLLDPQTLYHPLDRQHLREELQLAVASIEPNDEEAQLYAMLSFAQANQLRVAAADITGDTPLMKVSDHLTYIAEAVLEYALELAWAHLIKRHGHPCFEIDGESRRAGFAIIAYGKLGGFELGYGSDLDLVFVHNSRGSKQQTDGENCVDNQLFFTRLAQRLIHLLNVRLSSGQLYELDMRLRPNGKSGLLVTSLDAFEKYQRESAWIWEHQALVKTRAVAGDAELCSQFEQVRLAVLGRARALVELKDEVLKMRDKMRQSLDKSTAENVDLKQGKGGLVDIEFMVQFAALRWGASYPSVIHYSDNIRIIEALMAEELIAAETGSFMISTYRALRRQLHRNSLNELGKSVDQTLFSEQRQQVVELSSSWFEV